MNVVDFSIPMPLLEPRSWRRPNVQSANEVWIVPLDLFCTTGGPLRAHLDRLAEDPHSVLLVRAPCFSGTDISARIRLAEATKELTRFPKLRLLLEGGRKEDISSLFPDVGPREMIELPQGVELRGSLKNWLNALVPDLSRAAQEAEVEYAREMPEVIHAPFIGLRFFGGFLRRKGFIEDARKFQMAWSRAQALFSPQNESEDRLSLEPGEIMLNPTLQIVRDDGVHVIVLWRHEAEVRESKIGIHDAAIIDELTEGGRLRADEVLAGALIHVPHLPHGRGAEPRTALAEALTRLTASGAILSQLA